jgi:hypothetical protein
LAGIDHLFELVPLADMDFGEALEMRLLTEHKLASTYELFVQLLEKEEYSERVLLYFPIELIPGSDWKPVSVELSTAIGKFKGLYLRKWQLLLSSHDLRANFIDGDIPEVELRNGPLPQVVKAAHLIPALIRKGLISKRDVELMTENNEDRVLKESLGQIWPLISRSGGTERPSPEKAVTKDESRWSAKWLSGRIVRARRDIDISQENHLRQSGGKPPARVDWEICRDKGSIIEECSGEIANALIATQFSVDGLKKILHETEYRDTVVICIESARKSIESLALVNRRRAGEIYLTFKPIMDELWETGDAEIQQTLESMWSKLGVIGMAERKHLEILGIRTPWLDGKYSSEDLLVTGLMKDASKAITACTELSRFLLPVVIAYGSRVKGYGTRNADIDMAVFIKAGVSVEHREHIQTLLSELLGKLGINGRALEFWLKKSGCDLRIRDFLDPDRFLGDSTLTHVLFGGIWVGDKTVIKEMYDKILSSYLFSKNETVVCRPARQLWLGELERDALQYRLMHKGYHHFYPEQRTKCIPSGMPDSKGAFWDPGYRRLATRLFLQKVFLPNID